MNPAPTSARDDDVHGRNQARLQELAASVRAVSVTGAELCRERGLTAQSLKEEWEAGRLLGVQVPLSSEIRFPRWQFRPDGSAHPLLPQLLTVAETARLSPLQLHELVTNRAAGIGGRPLAEQLDDQPREVLAIVRASGDVGS